MLIIMSMKVFLELVMRLSPPVLALSLALFTVASVSHGQRPDAKVVPQSAALVTEGRALLAAGKVNEAIDAFETALVVDPRNRSAYVALARASEAQELPGKAIRYYREALLIEPNDVVALSGQGEAMVQKGALAKARENLARVKQLCVTACREQEKLAMAIDKASAPTVVSSQAIQPRPVASEAPSKVQ
jgi:tetratricopeptide (TPR) repeat protein